MPDEWEDLTEGQYPCRVCIWIGMGLVTVALGGLAWWLI